MRRGWIKRFEKCPVFWRQAVKKAIEKELEASRQRELDRRFHVDDDSSRRVMQLRMRRNEVMLQQHHPGWVDNQSRM